MRHVTMRVMATVRDPDRLKAAIRDRGMTYAGVSRYAGLKSRTFLTGLANGRSSNVSPRTAELIAEAVGVPVDELFVETLSPLTRRSVPRRATGRAA